MGWFLKWGIPSRHHGVQYFMVWMTHQMTTIFWGVCTLFNENCLTSKQEHHTKWFPTNTQHFGNFRPPVMSC